MSYAGIISFMTHCVNEWLTALYSCVSAFRFLAWDVQTSTLSADAEFSAINATTQILPHDPPP